MKRINAPRLSERCHPAVRPGGTWAGGSATSMKPSRP
jgi:hypothetical protein